MTTSHDSCGTTMQDDDPPPHRPSEPDPETCCGEGCVPCVYDRYDEALERYREALSAWRARHPGVDPDA